MADFLRIPAKPLIGAQIVSNTALDFELIDRLLKTLSIAGFSDDSLVRAYNAVFAAMLGFVTLDFAPSPTTGGEEWAEQLRVSIERVDAARFPHLHSYKKRIMNKSFVLRWENGADQPMNGSFDIYVEIIVGGLEKLLGLENQGTPSRRKTSSQARGR